MAPTTTPVVPPALPASTEAVYAGLAEAPLVVPPQLVQYYMRKSGQGPLLYNMSSDERECNEDMRLTQVVSLAAQRFLATVLNDAMQYHKMKRAAGPKAMKESGLDPKEKRKLLRTDDLAQALQEYGVTLRNPPYYVDAKDSAAAGGRR
ncbi:hypothetical protein HYH03_008827 [Edaphochlamys debaryana]|uniref:Transcription initiation factor TFIID subunit 10 n=1 Tax=Edaphochlamys debaryana TaxID=47281 RepID=A0A835Y060_9CHLO|nr:hypothetical protein HYH03_008827 [Edaphochlamys debaryana]|eukprot:KAG2492914.1 hypothetical protein HYH03_008827 [Edaphochlamys debaryana]